MERLAGYSPLLYTGTESPKQKDAAKNAFINGGSQLLIISLRSGAGLDGLQAVCSTVVKGELDYSPSVHDQCIGRLYRDGQELSVMVHYLISEYGSDPIIADILGIKRGQIEGVINPDGDSIEKTQVDPGYIKRLASDYLTRMGIELPVEESV
jgi:SNF2 family DNA or RNA helicase